MERQLAAVSHADEAALIVESAVAERFKKTAQRQIAFAQPNIICVEPICYSGALASGAIKAHAPLNATHRRLSSWFAFSVRSRVRASNHGRCWLHP
ncbi:MAG: hypothetical protein K2X03_11425 [Bryobacteraceae bacterium]|nr:hypothetical protein [Bryobacteraceae bacterium]